MDGQNILFFLGCLLASYHLFLSPSGEVKPFDWAQPFTVPLKSGDVSSQSKHIWNYMAPLSHDVSERVSRQDIRKLKRIPSDLTEVPRSVLLHEAEPFPENITPVKVLYQVVLFAAGAIVLSLYVVPLFRVD